MHSFCFFSMKGVGGNLRDLSGCNFCVFFFIYFSTRYGELLSQIIECRTGPWSKEQLNYTILRGLEAMGLCSLTENLLTRNLNSKISVWNPNSRWYGDGSMGKCACCTRVRVWAQVPASQKKKDIIVWPLKPLHFERSRQAFWSLVAVNLSSCSEESLSIE